MTLRPSRPVLCLALAGMLLCGAVRPAAAQAVIKVNDDVNLKFGVLGQFQADSLEDPGKDARIDNLFIRRVRLLFGGQVAKNVTFFIETDSANLGKTVSGAKNIGSTTILQDAYGEFKLHQALMVDAGLMYVPFSHNSLQSGATLLPIDYGAYTFTQSGPTQSSVGRDTGFQARGFLGDNRLEYRIGVFQGARDPSSHRDFRYAGRAQYNFLDADTGFFYAGTYLGKKKMLTVGGAFDRQEHYHGYDADLFAEHPAGPGTATLQFDYNRFDGGTTVAVAKQNDVLLEVGYLITALKLTPVAQIARRNIVDTSNGDETRSTIGVNYWWSGHNANVKAAFTRIDPAAFETRTRTGGVVITSPPTQNEFTLQLQLFFF